MPEEEEDQNIENLFEKIMEESFLNLVKEIDIQVQEAQRVPNKLDTNIHPDQNAKGKDNERLLKTAREKQRVTYKGVPIRLSADFSKETLLARSIQSHEKQGPTTWIALSSKAII